MAYGTKAVRSKDIYIVNTGEDLAVIDFDGIELLRVHNKSVGHKTLKDAFGRAYILVYNRPDGLTIKQIESDRVLCVIPLTQHENSRKHIISGEIEILPSNHILKIENNSEWIMNGAGKDIAGEQHRVKPISRTSSKHIFAAALDKKMNNRIINLLYETSVTLGFNIDLVYSSELTEIFEKFILVSNKKTGNTCVLDASTGDIIYTSCQPMRFKHYGEDKNYAVIGTYVYKDDIKIKLYRTGLKIQM